MKKIFATNLLLLLFLNAIVKPVWIFAIDRNVQITLGAEEYGLFFAMFNFSILFGFILDMGITNFNNREVSFYPNTVSLHLANLAAIKLFLAIIYLVVTFLMAGLFQFSNRHITLLVILSLNQVLASLVLFVRSNINGLQLFRLDSILSITDKAFLIAILSIFLWTPLKIGFCVEVFAFSQTAAYLATLIIAVNLLFSKYKAKIQFGFGLNNTYSLMRKGFPFAMLVLLMTLYSRIDTVLIERLSNDGATSAGIYAQAFRLFDAFNMYPYLFASLMLPIYSRMISEGKGLSDIFNFSLQLMVIPVILVAVPTIFFGHSIMDILYVEHVHISSVVMQFLMGSFIFVSTGYLFGTALTAKGDIWLLCRISLIAVIANILLQFYVIPRHGVTGAAAANLGVNFLASTLQGVYFFRRFKIQIRKQVTLKLLAYITLAFAITFLSISLIGETISGYLVSVGLVLASIFILRLVPLKSAIEYLKSQ